MIHSCKTEEDFQQLRAESQTKPVFLFKHSTRCPVSAGAHARFVQFAEEFPDLGYGEVLVVEDRALSASVAAQTGITHQSPQVILLMNGKAVWSESHYSITRRAMLDALEAQGIRSAD